MKKIHRLLLFILILSTSNRINVKAETVDDLREVTGNRRINTIETITEINQILKRKQDSDEVKELAEYASVIEEKLIKKNEEELKKLYDDKLEKEKVLLELVSNDQPVYAVLTVLKDLEDIVNRIQQLNSAKNLSISIQVDEDDSIDEQYEYAKGMLESIENDFELGHIGKGLKPPTSGIFKLTEAYGIYLDNEAGTTKIHNDFVRFKTLNYEDTIIVSQWNGKIKSIDNGKIVIQHGPSLITEYDKIKDIKVKVGDIVKQYEELGVADGDDIYFAVKLDGKYIDPMTIYGEEGIKIYYDWVNANPFRIIQVNDMSKVKNEVEIEVEPILINDNQSNNIDNQEDVINATLPEDYEAPNPGIIQ